MVFRCGAKHRRAADVDIFDQRGEIVGLRALLLKRIEIDRQQIDPGDSLFLHGGEMRVVVPARQQPAMDVRMQRLHPTIHDLGKAGDLGNIGNRKPGVAKRGRGATGRQDLEPLRGEAGGEGNKAGLVGNG